MPSGSLGVRYVVVLYERGIYNHLSLDRLGLALQ